MAVEQDQIRAARRRAAPAVAISLAVHAALFLAIGLMVPRPSYRLPSVEPTLTVALIRPLPELRTRPAARASSAAPSPSREAQAILPRVHIPLIAPPKSATPSPVPAAPQAAQGAAARAGTSVAPGPLPADDTPHGVQALLRRTMGCDYAEAAHLTPEEKAACARRFGDMARKAEPFSAIPDDKRGEYSIQAAANAKMRAAHDQNVPMTQPIQTNCHDNFSNLGVGCLPPEAINKVH